VSKTAETDPSRPRPRPHNSCFKRSRDADRGLGDYISTRLQTLERDRRELKDRLAVSCDICRVMRTHLDEFAHLLRAMTQASHVDQSGHVYDVAVKLEQTQQMLSELFNELSQAATYHQLSDERKGISFSSDSAPAPAPARARGPAPTRELPPGHLRHIEFDAGYVPPSKKIFLAPYLLDSGASAVPPKGSDRIGLGTD